MEKRRNILLVLDEKKLIVVQCDNETVLGEFTLDEVAELMEFRYATPWNTNKDSLEKLMLIIGDIKNAYLHSDDTFPEKNKILREVKLRLQRH